MKRFTLAAVSFGLMAAQSLLAEEQKEAPAKVKHQGGRQHTGGQVRQFAPNPGVQRAVGNGPRQFNAQRQFRNSQPNTAGNISPRVYNPARIRQLNGERRVNSSINPVTPAQSGQAAEVAAGRRWNNGALDGSVSGGTRGNWRGGNNNGDQDWRNHRGNSGEVNRTQNWAGRTHGHWDRSRRDRSYWTSHYNRFARFGGGYYYFDAGYWYPAYGYDPYFTTYSYDAPIYAYNDQEPGQVIANVQAELQRRGYNAGGVDGTYGPQTRRAILNYQADTGLPSTGEIDEATLDSLGLQ